MNNTKVSFRENSRKNYMGSHKLFLRKREIINCGSLQRIADALEDLVSLLRNREKESHDG